MSKILEYRAKDFYGNWQIGMLCQDANGRYCIQKWSEGNNELKLKTKSNVPIDKNTISRFTGRKNFWENDIVKITGFYLLNKEGDKEQISFIAKIVYCNKKCAFAFEEKENKTHSLFEFDLLRIHDKSIVRIGNAIDNSELLS
jgi:hypothetical protein